MYVEAISQSRMNNKCGTRDQIIIVDKIIYIGRSHILLALEWGVHSKFSFKLKSLMTLYINKHLFVLILKQFLNGNQEERPQESNYPNVKGDRGQIGNLC